MTGESAPSITEWAATVRRAAEASGLGSEVRLTAEPGRAIVAGAAVTCYSVGTIKEIPGVRTYLSVDGGMSDNPRPVLYGSGYEAFLVRADRRHPAPHRHGGRQALRVGRRDRPRRSGAGGRRRSATCWPRRSPAPTAIRWPRPTTRCPRPPVVFVRDGSRQGRRPAGEPRRPAGPGRIGRCAGCRASPAPVETAPDRTAVAPRAGPSRAVAGAARPTPGDRPS